MSDKCCYLCNECDKAYPTMEELIEHIHSHQTENLNGFVQTSTDIADIMHGSDDNNNNASTMLTDGSNLEAASSTEPMEQDGDTNDSGAGSSSNISSPNGADYNGKSEKNNADEIQQKFSCGCCSITFDDSSQLINHHKLAHRDKPQYECDICHQIFTVKRELSTHMRKHSGEQPHICRICDKEFGTRQLLKKHNMWHTGQRTHVCKHCNKAFYQKGHLTQHLMIHDGGRPHKCPLCLKTFIFKFDLNRHMKIHAERSFSCEKCGRSFLKELQRDEHLLKCKSNRNSLDGNSNTPIDLSNSMNSNDNCSEGIPSPNQLPTSNPSMQLIGEDFNKFAYMMALQHQQEQIQQQQQHHQQVLNVAASVHSNLQSANPVMQAVAIQNIAQSLMFNSMNMPQRSRIVCYICFKSFNSQFEYGHHMTTVHIDLLEAFRGNQVTDAKHIEKSSQLTAVTDELEGSVLLTETMIVEPSSDTLRPSAETSPQQDDTNTWHTETTISPEHTTITNSSHLNTHCGECERNRQRVSELERDLTSTALELRNTQELMRRISAMAGSLIESCSSFDKQWLNHNRKVHSQLESAIYNMD